MRRYCAEFGEASGRRNQLFDEPPSRPPLQGKWYLKFFFENVHQIFVGQDNKKHPFYFSIKLDGQSSFDLVYKSVLFQKCGIQNKVFVLPRDSKPHKVKDILANIFHKECNAGIVKEIFNPDIKTYLLLLEEQEKKENFKFAITYMKDGQSSYEEIFNNEFGSRSFDKFLATLGDDIYLRGWKQYNGGLDVQGDMTGKKSVYTKFNNFEIMFHVSTLLPHLKDNPEQEEKRRYIGNDIVNIVFIDTNSAWESAKAHQTFNPNWIQSQFSYIIAVVTIENDKLFRLSLYYDETVPPFGPSLPWPPLFSSPERFKDFLLSKLINGEKATLQTPSFAEKRQRFLEWMFKDLHTTYMNEDKVMLYNRRRRSSVQLLSETATEELQLKDTSRKDSFAYNMHTLFSRRSYCIYPIFPNCTIFCGDSWYANCLLIATNLGVFIVEDGSHRRIFDESLQVKQLNVLEDHGIIIMRADQGYNQKKLYAFRFSDIKRFTSPQSCQDIKDYSLKKVSDVNIYAVSRSTSAKLRVAVAIKNTLLLLEWNQSVAWRNRRFSDDTRLEKGFITLWKNKLKKTPIVLTILDNRNCFKSNDISICIGYENYWEILNGRNGKHVYTITDRDHSSPKIMVDLYKDQERRVMLCYSNTCHIGTINEEGFSKDFEFHWNLMPTNIVHVFPFIIGFTEKCMEIRVVVNGDLICLLPMPNLQLIAFKSDIFYATTAPDFLQNKNGSFVAEKQQELPGSSTAFSEMRNLRIFHFSNFQIIHSHELTYRRASIASTSSSRGQQSYRRASIASTLRPK